MKDKNEKIFLLIKDLKYMYEFVDTPTKQLFARTLLYGCVTAKVPKEVCALLFKGITGFNPAYENVLTMDDLIHEGKRNL